MTRLASAPVGDRFHSQRYGRRPPSRLSDPCDSCDCCDSQPILSSNWIARPLSVLCSRSIACSHALATGEHALSTADQGNHLAVTVILDRRLPSGYARLVGTAIYSNSFG